MFKLRDQLTRMETAENKGEAKGIAKIANNLLNMGMEISEVVKAVGLSEKEVRKLLEES
ncbi:MAG: hypothetical protein WA131_03335 [Desulfitobacteriaceae bacterium]